MRLYTPPPGTYDLPFTWAFDASALMDGQSYLNNLVYIKGGYGEFVMRRIVGLSRILNPTTGQYQIRDGMLNNIEQAPLFGSSADQNAILPELIYPEQGGIRFDLFNLLRPNPQPGTAQVAFQGVRRMKGQAQANPNYKATPKSFTYTMQVPVNAPVGSVTRGRVLMDNYDFELHQLIILGEAADTVTLFCEAQASILFQNIPGNTPPFNQVTINIPYTIGTTVPLNITVVGNVITIQLATDSILGTLTTGAELVAALQAIPAVNAILLVSCTGFCTLPAPQCDSGGTSITLGGAGFSAGALATPISSLWIYDRNRVQISNEPVLDLYCDGGPGGVYKNGAIVTPLWYPKDSQIQIDFYSQLDGVSTPASANVTVYLVGKKYYPC